MQTANPNSLQLVLPKVLHLRPIYGYTPGTVISTGFYNPLFTVLYRVNDFVFTALNIFRLGFRPSQLR